jgi:hypothetical protein
VRTYQGILYAQTDRITHRQADADTDWDNMKKINSISVLQKPGKVRRSTSKSESCIVVAEMDDLKNILCDE